MKRIFLILCFLACLINPVMGEITGPQQLDMGKLLVVKCTDTADVFMWTVPEGIDGVFVDGNKEFHGAGLAGTYKFQLTTLTIDWDNRKITQSPTQTYTVVIGTPKPPDPVNPQPDLTGLAKDIYVWASGVSAHKYLAVKLSSNYKQVATRYQKAEITVEQALEAIRTLNNQTLDNQEKRDAWAVFGSRLEDKMSSAWPMDKNTMVKFLNDVALGLSYVK